MSNVEKFEELLRSDEGLQAKLWAATEAYQGDKADERAVFEAVIAPLAAEADLPFTYDEAEALVTSGAALGEDELAAIVGGHDDYLGQPDAGCLVIGFGVGADGCSSEHGGAGACIGVGIGIIGF